jgi:hypothetical protein
MIHDPPLLRYGGRMNRAVALAKAGHVMGGSIGGNTLEETESHESEYA